MKTTLAAALLALAGMASAADPAPAPATDPAAPASTPAADAQKPAEEPRRNCLRETGSRIKRTDGKCMPGPGSSYSRDDLDRTGDPTTAGALQRLDPAVTRH